MNTTTRVAHVVTLLSVIAIPVIGWFFRGWSGATTLVVYWFETAAGAAFVTALIALHKRWNPRRGHFRYRSPDGRNRGVHTASFGVGFAVTATVFCAAHLLFLVALLAMLNRNHPSALVLPDWRSVAFGCLSVLLFLAVDFALDLIYLRQWSFWEVEQTANRSLSRVVVVHLTLIFGLLGVAVTGVSEAFFGVFVVLKTLAALSFSLPQWDPKSPPRWLSQIMNRVPNVHPGKRFEEFWVADRANESARRDRNEEPWRVPG